MICSVVHEVPAAHGFPSIRAGVHAAATSAGSGEETTFPTASPATHRVLEAQEMLCRSLSLSICSGIHEAEAGSVETSSAPSPPTATQSDDDGQSIASRARPLLVAPQDPAMVGLVEV